MTINININTNVDNPAEAQLRIAMKSRIPVMMISDPGKAKTATIRKIAQEIDYGLVTLIGSRMDPQDISGFPTKGTHTYADGSTGVITEYAPNNWQVEIMEKKKVILFLDEFSNTHHSVRASMLSVLQDREFPNGDPFPEETIVVGAMNPTDSAADGFDLDPATSNRMFFISWNLRTKDWVEAMNQNFWRAAEISDNEDKWRKQIARFIDENPGRLHNMNSAEAGNTGSYAIDASDSSSMTVFNNAWSSPRSWDNLATVLGNCDSNSQNLEDNLMQGMVGFESAYSFRDWLRKNGALDVKGILKDPRAFTQWDSLTLDDVNIVVKTSLDMASKDTWLNVIDVFRILAENNMKSKAVASIQNLAEKFNGIARSPGMTKALKDEYRAAFIEITALYRDEIANKRK